MWTLPTTGPLTRTLLWGLLSAFVAELVLDNWVGLPVFAWLALRPGALHPGLLWQPVTYALVWPPGPQSVVPFLISLLLLWWALALYEHAVGARRALRDAAAVSVGAGLVAGHAGLVLPGGILSGTGPLLLGVIAAHAWRMRRYGPLSIFGLVSLSAQRLIAVLLALSFLLFLASRDAVALVADASAIGIGIALSHELPRFPRPRKRRTSGPRFVVVEGGTSDRKWVH